MKYQATVHFYSNEDGTHLGEERYEVEADDEPMAKRIASEMSEESVYDDPRVDIYRQIRVTEKISA